MSNSDISPTRGPYAAAANFPDHHVHVWGHHFYLPLPIKSTVVLHHNHPKLKMQFGSGGIDIGGPRKKIAEKLPKIEENRGKIAENWYQFSGT